MRYCGVVIPLYRFLGGCLPILSSTNCPFAYKNKSTTSQPAAQFEVSFMSVMLGLMSNACLNERHMH